jgi:hypothetical protein
MTTVPAKRTSATVNRYNQHALAKSNQQIATWNKYTPLHNLQDSDEDEAPLDQKLHHDQETQTTTISNETVVQHGREGQIPTIVNGKLQSGESQKSRGNKTNEWVHFLTPHNSTPHRTKRKTPDRHPKILVIGDSHTRGIAGELLHQAKYRFNTIGYAMPNAGLADIINSAEGKIDKLTRADTVIVFGGTNNIGKSEQCGNLTLTVKFLESTQNTNFLIMEIPVRYDTEARPLTCEQIASYNKKLHKITKKYEHVKLIKVTSRNHFTNHGFHLNHTGKETIATEILTNLPANCKGQSPPAIQLPWKDECENVHVPNTEKESLEMMSDNQADTEKARELNVSIDGKYIETKTDAETIATEILTNLPANCKGQSLPAIQLSWKDDCGNVHAPNTEKESLEMMLDNEADTEKARELNVSIDGKYIETITDAETDAEARLNLAGNEIDQHQNKQETSNNLESGETSKEISRNQKSQRKCLKVKNDAFLWT